MRCKNKAALLLSLLILSGCSAYAERLEELPPEESIISSVSETSETSVVSTEAPEESSAPFTSASPAESTAPSSSENEKETVPETPYPETRTSDGQIDAAVDIAEPETEPAAEYTEEQKARFSEKLDEIYKKYDIIGMGVAVFSDEEIIYEQSLGYADRENKIPCTDSTKFRAASVSKIPSTIVLMQLCDMELLNIDSYLTDVTGIDFDDPTCGERVKLRHLLTHTAGLVDTWAYNRGITYKYDISRVLQNSHSGMEPGTYFNYCNFGAGAIGAVAESITGKYFHDLADEMLFKPLGMDAGYTIDKLSDSKSAANVYDYDGEIFKVSEWGRTSDYYESFGLGNSYLTAQCELLISASDLAKIGIILSGDGSVDGVRILSDDALKDMHREYFKTDNFDMGLNLRIYKGNMVEGRTIYGHPGNALGAVNGLFYDPSSRTGVAILTNHCSVYMNEQNGTYGMLSDVVSEAYSCFFDGSSDENSLE